MAESHDGAAGEPDGAGADEGQSTSDQDRTLVDAPASKRRSGESLPSAAGEQEFPADDTRDEDSPTAKSADSEPSGATLSTIEGRSGPGSSLTSAVTSPVEAMLLAEIGRTRNFLYIVFVVCALMLGLLPVLNGNVAVEIALAIAIAVCAAVAAYLYRAIRDPARYTPALVVPVALCSAVTSSLAVLYWGAFSPAPTAVVMGMYFFSRAKSFTGALLVYLTCAGMQGAFSIVILAGIASDPGLVVPAGNPFYVLVLTQILVQLVYLSTFFLARTSRKAEMHGIEQLRQAVRQVSQREALLQEARQELDRALRVGGPGRYTDQVLDRFKLGTVIGRGAMGEVYEAVHVETDELAAIKLLHPNVLAKPDHVARFLREAEAIGAFELPHVVRVLHASDPLEPVPYLAMERLTGHDLAHYLRRRRRLPERWIAALVEQVGSVIDAARAKGIVHRDLKPKNLFRAEQPGGEPVWKILDFGVSKLGEHSGTLTQGRVVGTPAYMAPEQARGRDVDFRADLYSLAAIAYRCATGRPPFTGKDMPVILHNVVYSMPPRPGEIASLHADVDHALAVGLAKRPGDRFASGAELAKAIALAFAGRLDEATRRRAGALQAETPWGERRSPWRLRPK